MEMTARVQAKGQVTIPARMRKRLNIRQGDLVVFEETPEGILLQPARVVTPEALKRQLSAEIRQLREQFGDLSDDEIQTLVAEAIQNARAETKS
jgi:AbrB family looped-hinge helix DNA binding protein